MKYETANRIYRTARSGTTDGNYRNLTNAQLEQLADAHSGHKAKRSAYADDPLIQLIELKIARARLKDAVRSTAGNHIEEVKLISELNKRIWKLDKKSHIRAMAARSY